MIMCFIVLVFWPLTNENCSDLLSYDYYHNNFNIHAKVIFNYGVTTASAKLSLNNQSYGYGSGIFGTAIVCLLGWVSDLLLYIAKL